ncbi:MAG: chemotaxis protein, partial [Balneolaceae bacterium]
IVDDNGRILADTDERILDFIEFDGREKLFAQERGYMQTEVSGKGVLVAHAQSPGYETYKSGWHSVIIQNSVS